MNTTEQLRNRLWDAREAASFLKVSRSWIFARVERDEMPYIRVGGLIRFVPSQLRDLAFTKDRIKGSPRRRPRKKAVANSGRHSGVRAASTRGTSSAGTVGRLRLGSLNFGSSRAC